MVQYLDPDIANEGVKVIDGDGGGLGEDYQPFIDAPRIPDYKWLTNKSKLYKYFPNINGRPYKHQAFPAIFYHADGSTKTIYNAEQAAAIGAKNLGPTESFKWECTGEWKAKPFTAHLKFNPNKMGGGKSIPPPTQSESLTAALTAALSPALKTIQQGASTTSDMIGAVVAGVLAALGKGALPAAGGAPAAPAPAPAPVAEPVAEPVVTEDDPLDIPPMLRRAAEPDPAASFEQMTPAQQKTALLKVAEEKGIKVDGRLSLDNIMAELDKHPG